MTQAIAATVSLALAVKLKMIFNKMLENGDKYLTFPYLAGLCFTYGYLEFMKDPFKTSLSAQDKLNFGADFSRQMNIIPEDNVVFLPDYSRFLWGEVRSILIDSIFAKSGVTSNEERQLAEAIDFLIDYQTDKEGNRVPAIFAASNQIL